MNNETLTEAELVNKYLPLAKRLASIQHRRLDKSGGLTVDDCFSDALVGLLRAVRTYKTDSRASLKTYATQIMMWEMGTGRRLRDRLPLSVRRNIHAGKRDPIEFQQVDKLSETDAEGQRLSVVHDLEFETFPAALERLGILDTQQAQIVHWLYIDGLMQREVAERLGITQAAISLRWLTIAAKLKAAGIARLRELIG